MATKIEKLKWNLHLKKRKLLYAYGLMTGRIHGYEKELMENLRHIYYGGVPASIILLCDSLCAGRCYDRGLLITLGFGDDDFQLVDADIDGIRLNPKYIHLEKNNPHYANHCFAERTKKDGSVWVYDTTIGLVFEKSLYYKMENPKITKINSKQATLNYCEYQDIKNADIERDKYVLPLILPNIELIASKDDNLYAEELRKEIALFKDEIGYEGICEEINNDMMRHGRRRRLNNV